MRPNRSTRLTRTLSAARRALRFLLVVAVVAAIIGGVAVVLGRDRLVPVVTLALFGFWSLFCVWLGACLRDAAARAMAGGGNDALVPLPPALRDALLPPSPSSDAPDADELPDPTDLDLPPTQYRL